MKHASRSLVQKNHLFSQKLFSHTISTFPLLIYSQNASFSIFSSGSVYSFASVLKFSLNMSSSPKTHIAISGT